MSSRLRSVAFELTHRCNQQCIYCYNADRGRPGAAGPEMSTQGVCSLVDRVTSRVKLGHITLTGGEPFLRDDLLDIVRHVNGRGLPVAIISNATRVRPAIASELARCRVAYVQVTLTGPTPREHDAFCGRGSFAAVMKGVSALVSAGVRVGGSFLCTHLNFHRAGRTLARLHAAGAKSHFAFNRFNASGHAVKQIRALLPTRSEVLEGLRQAERFAKEQGIRVHSTTPIPACMLDEAEFPHVDFGQCAVGTESAEHAVTPAGHLKMCPVSSRILGNLKASSLSALLRKVRLANVRRKMPRFCDGCLCRTGCLAGCRASAEWVFGRAGQPDPFLAQHIWVDFEKRLEHSRRKSRAGGAKKARTRAKGPA